MVNFIVCEFNPFHNGHAYLLEQAGDAPKICIMSSHITQRGEFAFCDKWTRAKMALLCGADMVLELPAPFAMGQASRFAAGAMEIARATGLEGRIVFGCEGQASLGLRTLADISQSQLSPILKKHLKSGLPYASALSAAYKELCPEYAPLLSTPNNLLGLEYIKAAPDFEFYAVSRKGVAHDAAESKAEYCSASMLRGVPERYTKFTPVAIHYLYKHILDSGLTPDERKVDLIWLHALRLLSVKDWDILAPDGVGRRIHKAVQNAESVNEALDNAKTKCCTHASLRRIAMKALIGDFKIEHPQYIRVLGVKKDSTACLSKMRATLPVLTKPAAVSELSSEAKALMEYESKLTDIYMHLLKQGQQKGLEFLTSPVII